MIADDSLSSAFDDLTDLFLGGGVGGTGPTAQPHAAPQSEPHDIGTVTRPGESHHAHSDTPVKPLHVEGLVLGHLPMMAALWASQYPRMAAAADNAPVALVRLDAGTARVELFHPPQKAPGNSRISGGYATSDRPSPDLAGALSRAAHIASRIVVYSSTSADELLLARSSTVRAMAVLTGADDTSAVGAYKAIKRLAPAISEPDAAHHGLLFRVAVMGSDEAKASAAFHRLADAVKSFIAIPVESAGHCRQIAGGIPGTILFEGPSAMTTQAVLEALARPAAAKPAEPATRFAPVPQQPQPAIQEATTQTEPPHFAPVEQAVAPATPPMHHAQATPVSAAPSFTPPGLTPLPIRCPFDRDPVLAIDQAGIPQVIATAAAGESAQATQRLLSVGAWLWTSRELLSMVCPTLRTDAQPILHLVTDRPTDVKRLLDSDLRLHLRVQPVPTTGTLPLN